MEKTLTFSSEKQAIEYAKFVHNSAQPGEVDSMGRQKNKVTISYTNPRTAYLIEMWRTEFRLYWNHKVTQEKAQAAKDV